MIPSDLAYSRTLLVAFAVAIAATAGGLFALSRQLRDEARQLKQVVAGGGRNPRACGIGRRPGSAFLR